MNLQTAKRVCSSVTPTPSAIEPDADHDPDAEQAPLVKIEGCRVQGEDQEPDQDVA